MIIAIVRDTRHQFLTKARALAGTHLWVCVLAGIVAAATLPRAWLTYGPDENGPNSAQAALNLARTGVYRTPRDPGNPLFDYLLALVVPARATWARISWSWVFMCWRSPLLPISSGTAAGGL